MILITAAGGKVGQHVATQLEARGVAVRAATHKTLDFDDPQSVRAAFEGVERMFLVTPGSPDQGRFETNLLAEAKRVGVKRIVKLSGKISQTQTVGFSVWNREAEARVKATGIPFTILRANFFMQNLLGSAAQIKAGAFTAGPAAKKVALIDTRDIAACAVAALLEEGHEGKTYDLNGPELIDGNDQAAVFARVLDRPVRYLDVSVGEFIAQLKSFGLPEWMVEAFGAAAADTSIPSDQSSADLERLIHRKPGALAQFIADNREVFS